MTSHETARIIAGQGYMTRDLRSYTPTAGGSTTS